jgi:cysteine desulfurase
MLKTKMNRKIYLDYAAATPLDDKVFKAMVPFFKDDFYNPSALYLNSVAVKKQIEQARFRVASILGCKSNELIFTAGATEACNLAISGLLDKHPGFNVVISGVEHSAVYSPSGRYERKICSVNEQGILDLEELERRINDETVLVSVIYASNEIGSVQPLKKISRIISAVRRDRACRGVNSPLYLHSDASQAGNYLELLVNSLGVDLMTLNGAKMYGPKQSAVLYIKSGVLLNPLVIGGGQEGSLRSGTESPANIVGFAESLDLTQQIKKEENKRLRTLRKRAIENINTRLKNATVNGQNEDGLPNIISLTLPDTDNERVVMELDEKGIMVGMGSACAASDKKPSRVLEAIGLSKEEARSTIRISFGKHTTENDLDLLIDYLGELTS